MKASKLIIVFFSFIALSVSAQPGKKIFTIEAEGQPSIKFEEMVHDFGTIVEGTQATYEFTYTNTGKTPLIITDVKPPCSCTIPEWSKDPLQPGKSSKIKVTFDSKAKSGSFTKTIEVKHNGESARDYITIKGIVGT